MKKTYLYPAIEIQTAEAVQFIALSLQDGNASPDSEPLAKSSNWDIWNDEDDLGE